MLVGSFVCDLGNLAHSADEQWFYLIMDCSFEPQMFFMKKKGMSCNCPQWLLVTQVSNCMLVLTSNCLKCAYFQHGYGNV